MTPDASATVPVIDLSVATSREVVDALIAHSCVFLVGHGLGDDALAPWLRTARDFFALPENEKATVQWSGEGPWQGWQPVYAGGPQALLLERFEVALRPGGRALPPQEWADTFALWPAHPEAMKDAWTTVYTTMHDLASRVTAMIAEGLGLPADDVPAWTTRQHSNLVVNHYFAQDEAPAPGRVRQRAHTDIGGVTLLWTDGTPGLEARIGADGAWVPVTTPPGSLLLQAGDLLHLWSRGRIPANDHRVVNPPRGEGASQAARYSAVYFHHPDLATWVAPALPSLESSAEEHGGTADEVGVTAIDHIITRQHTSAAIDATSHVTGSS